MQEIIFVGDHIEDIFLVFPKHICPQLLPSDLEDSIRFRASSNALFKFVLSSYSIVFASEAVSQRYFAKFLQVSYFYFKLIFSNGCSFCPHFLVIVNQCDIVDVSLRDKVEYFSLMQGVTLWNLFVLLPELPGFLFEVSDGFLLTQFFLQAKIVQDNGSRKVFDMLLSFRKDY